MFRKLLATVLLLAPVSQITAQTTVRFISAAPEESTDKYELVAKKKHSDPFSIPTKVLSAKMHASSRDLSLVPVDKEEDADPFNFSLPRSGRDFVVVLSKKDDALNAFVLRADDRSFKAGEVFIHNSSAHTVRGVLGSTEFSLEAGKGATFRPKVSRKAESIEVQLFYIKDGKDSPLSKTKWPVEENNRSYLFFFTGDRDLPDYRAVDEFVDPNS